MSRPFPSCVLVNNAAVLMTASKLCYVIIIASACMGWWWWMGRFPLELTSDDALNFSRGVERFSVLEFRPHFPGYPAFIGLSRLAAIWVEAAVASIWVSMLSAMLIPLLVARLVYLLSSSWPAATLGCVLALMQPLLASMALSGLSDSTAIMVFLSALIAALQQKHSMVGFWIGLMLATRPSYLPLALGMAMLPCWGNYVGSKIRAYLQASIAIAAIGSLSLGFIWFHDGAAYFEEGIRFTQGHFTIWGNTVEGDNASLWQWVEALGKGFGWLGLIVVLVSLFSAVIGLASAPMSKSLNFRNQASRRQQLALTAVIAWLYWAWITFGQNPDNLRHWAPVLFLFLTVLPVQLAGLQKIFEASRLGVVAVSVLGICPVFYCLILGYQNVQSAPSQAPIQQAMSWIRANPKVTVVGTNYSVNLLRAQLGSHAIYDMYYPSSKLALVNAHKRTPQSAWRLSGTRLTDQQLVTEFSPRFIGERRLFLYQISQ